MSENVHLGHRMRMRRKLAEYGDHIFDDYELLEMLLYFSVPVKNTNPIAKAVISRFGSLDGVLRASVEELMQVPEIGEKSARLIYDAGRTFMTVPDDVEEKCQGESGLVFSSYEEAGDYLVGILGEREDYCVGMLSLDSSMGFISFDMICSRDYSSAAVRPKEFIEVAMRRSASVVIIAHSHPHGPLYPSEGDMQTNFLIKDSLDGVGVLLAEHFIITGKKYIGIMNHIPIPSDESGVLGRFMESKTGGGQRD